MTQLSVKPRKEPLLVRMKRFSAFYLFLLIPLAQVIIFNYMPMYGIQIAFKDYKMRRGINGSSWAGLEHFQKMFSDTTFYQVLGNTLRLSLESTLIIFPATVIFALMMNELRAGKFKRVTQTITYLPHFLSWVVVGGFVTQVLSPTNRVLNCLLVKLGILDQPVYFMIEPSAFDAIYILSSMWKELGWGVIIYLATISGIDPTLYEAASIDGAGRFKKVLHITFPSILPTVTTMLILQMGTIMSVGFDPIFNLYTPGTYSTADVISTYVYRRGLLDTKYDYTTAIGLFQNVVSLTLVLLSNWIARKATPDYRIF